MKTFPPTTTPEPTRCVCFSSHSRFEAVTSQHRVISDVKTVVTASSGRLIDELEAEVARLRSD